MKYQVIQYILCYTDKPRYFCKCFEIWELFLFIYAYIYLVIGYLLTHFHSWLKLGYF